MCSVVILRRPGHGWPLLLAANRDEMLHRPWLPPGRHWPDRADIVAGQDQTAGGSWLGLNDSGLVAAVLNGENALGPAAGRRSRGELVLDALDHADAAAAADALMDLDPAAWRPFNLVLADNRDAFFLTNRPDEDDSRGERPRMRRLEIPAGVSMVTASDLNDIGSSPRQRLYLPLFRAAAEPDPDQPPPDGWGRWIELLSCRIWDTPEAGPRGAMNIVTDVGFGTSSSSLIALPSIPRLGTPPLWHFAPGRPDTVPYARVEMGT